jgi:hypothetical protein
MTFTLDDLTLAAADRATLSDFLNSWVEHGRPVLFVGAGMSRYNAVRRRGAPSSAEIKDWGGLVATLRERLAAGDDDVLRRLPADYLRLAQLHETQFQRVRLLDAVEEALASAHFDPGPAHARLKRFEWEAIITTNYDDLLERTFADSQTRLVTKVVWDVDLTRRRPARTLLLVKMHGDLQDRDSIVLTEEDYRCYEQGRPGVALKVKQLLLEHPSLFIGFSLSDPNVGAIEGWIRDTTGQLKLPSVVLVHSEPLIAERDMWARRGIKLVHVPQSESLARVLDALPGERQRREKVEPLRRESAGDRAMDQLLEQRKEGWEADAAKLLVRLADGAHESEFASAVRYALQGGIRNVPAESIQKVLEALGSAGKRQVLLRAHANGVLEAGGSGRKVLDIEQYLLDDAPLSPSERGSVLVNRATRAQQQGKLEAARDDLFVARALDLDAPTRDRLQKALRGVLLRIGDDAAIREELLDSPLPEDAFGYARRGADALLTRGRSAALRWYGEALKYARTGDEKTAALQGLQVCAEPDDWSRSSALDEERMAILPEERPRSERVYELQSAAGRKLLAMHRVGPGKASHEPDQAIEKLREALEEADDMGWPKSVRANVTTVADGLALEIIGLLLANEPSTDKLQQALAFAIERGLFGVVRHFDTAVFDGLVSQPEAILQTRALLQSRAEAPFMARSRSLLRSALLPLLSDEQISKHIETCVDTAELDSGSFFDKSSTESHLELLAKHYECVPTVGAEHLLRFFAHVLRSAVNRSALRASWLRAPIDDWTQTGVVKPTDSAVRDCVSALTSVFERGLIAKDPFVGQVAFLWLHEFVDARVLTDDERQDFVRLLDAELAQASTASPIDESGILEFARARAQLGSWSPSPEVRAIFVGSYAKLKNSTGIGRWLTLVGRFADALTADERESVVRDIIEYAAATLGDRPSVFGPFPAWAAEAISQAATSGLLAAPDALLKLRELARKFPEVLAVAVDLPGIDVEAVEQELLGALAVEREDFSILRWCQDLPANRRSPRLERIALGGLHARDGRSRQLAYWSCAALAKNDNLSDAGRAILAEAISKFGAIDRDWHVRGAAVAAASRILDAFESGSLQQLLTLGSADSIARVRRAAGFLALSMSAKATV